MMILIMIVSTSKHDSNNKNHDDNHDGFNRNSNDNNDNDNATNGVGWAGLGWLSAEPFCNTASCNMYHELRSGF